jgi:Fe-S cluster assembly protein SufD
MTAAIADKISPYSAAFEQLQKRNAPLWLKTLRETAFARFTQLGFPTTKNEEWRFTNVGPIARTNFALGAGSGSISHADIEANSFGGVSSARVVFVNGRFRADLSAMSQLPRGVRVLNMAQALAELPDLVQTHLAKLADFSADAFTALNTAFIEDGSVVHIERDTHLEEPIHLLLLATDALHPLVSHPRHLIVAEAGSSATVVEHYVSLGQGAGFSNAVTEAVVAPHADLRHYLLERENFASFNVQSLALRQDHDSKFESHSVLLGGAIVRNNITATLAGPRCLSLINGLYLPRGTQHMDNHMRVVHAAEHCDSRQFYKGILDDKSSAVFSGRIVVNPGAQKTDAKQTNRNLLLSDDAVIDTKPQLEIYADDVKCTHGATTGRLDENALFYLRSRGIPTDIARGLLIYAFAHEALERMTIEPIRRRLERLLVERLPHGKVLEQLI